MRSVILIAAVTLSSLASVAQTMERPTRVNENDKKIPVNEWITYGDGEIMYKGTAEHVDETAWVVLYETEGNWGDDSQESVRENDRYETITIDGDVKSVYIWDMSNGKTLRLLLDEKNDIGVILIYDTSSK